MLVCISQQWKSMAAQVNLSYLVMHATKCKTLTLRMRDGKVCAYTGILDAPECTGRKPFTAVKCLVSDFPI